jgi:CBS-domain-containing membrane protein
VAITNASPPSPLLLDREFLSLLLSEMNCMSYLSASLHLCCSEKMRREVVSGAGFVSLSVCAYQEDLLLRLIRSVFFVRLYFE